jgi:LAO/AO transport system kinase
MIHYTSEEFLELIPKRDMRAIARLISLQENKSEATKPLMAKLYKKAGKARIIGVTGSPGAGKSTLVDQLVVSLRKLGKSVAVLAIDPSSPFSGGAVLGDRIRMATATEDPDVYVRSLATRGALGGLSRATLDSVHILDAAGFDVIIIETVGVGQQEVDIVRTAHTCLVVLVPGMGDGVQALKAGILEIADVFVINKADRDGADQLQKELRVMQSLGHTLEHDWSVPIVKTIASEAQGVDELVSALTHHGQWLAESAAGAKRRARSMEGTLLRMLQDLVAEKVLGKNHSSFKRIAEQCLAREVDPYSAIEKLFLSASDGNDSVKK